MMTYKFSCKPTANLYSKLNETVLAGAHTKLESVYRKEIYLLGLTAYTR